MKWKCSLLAKSQFDLPNVVTCVYSLTGLHIHEPNWVLVLFVIQEVIRLNNLVVLYIYLNTSKLESVSSGVHFGD